MKKIFVSMLVAVMLMTTVASAAPETYSGRGGFMGFIGGCCFGLRTGAAYNDGKELLWREWCRIIPVVGLVIGIWDGYECAYGKKTSDFASQYGQMYY